LNQSAMNRDDREYWSLLCILSVALLNKEAF